MKEMPPIPDDSEVWISTDRGSTSGRIVSQAPTPRCYVVETDRGKVHRNQSQLRVVPDSSQTQEPNRIVTRSQAGVVLKPPDRLA